MQSSEEGNLPDGWEERFDTIHARVFYVHPERRLAQLEDPRTSGLQTRQYGKDWININESNSPLDHFPWFHGNITKRETDNLLYSQSREWNFSCKKSQSNPGWFVLAVKYSTHSLKIFQFQIKQRNGYYRIDTEDSSFSTIPKLVEFYTSHNELMCGKLSAPLDKFEMKEVIEIPDELADDPRTIELYEKAVKEGTERDNNIRVMVIGCYGQGKTSLVRRLLKESIEDVETTNGIDLHKCAIIKDMEWEKMKTEDIEGETVQRLINIALEDTTYMKASNVTDIENIQSQEKAVTLPTTSESSSIEVTGKFLSGNNLVIIDKSDDYMEKKKRNSIKSKFASADETSERKDNINYQHFSLFKTELDRIESDKKETKTNNSVTLNIWDFGGQFVYYATHQIFHSKQAVYVLVFNLSIGLETVIEDKEFPLHQKTMRDYLKFWVTSVNSFVGSTDGTEPAIILVGTHMDKLDIDSNPSDYFEEVRQLFDDSICLNHIQPEQFAISNTSESETEIDHLRSYISNLGQRQLETRIPAKWILLDRVLKMAKEKRIISLIELLEMDSQTDSPIQTDYENESMEQIKLFLSYHHAKGTFCYFDENNLADHVVLDPQFLIDAFRCIITSENFCKVRPKLRSAWKELCNTAILRQKLFDEVWRRESNRDFYKFSSLLIEYMQKHHIIAEVLACDNDSESEVERLEYFIVPSLLKVSVDNDIMESFLKGKPLSYVSLCYVLKYETMLPFIFQTCLAAVIGQWPLIKFKDILIIYDNAAACEIERGHAAVLKLSKHKLELLVVSLCPPDNVKATVCDMFRRYIEMVMARNIHKLYGKRDERPFIKHIAVRCMRQVHGVKGSNETVNIETVRSDDKNIPCPDKASHCMKVQSILQEWFLQDSKFDNVPNRKLTNKEYSTLSMAIGQGWQLLGSQLGLDTIIVEHICMDKDTTAMRIYEMLLAWDKKEAQHATLDVLVNAIQSCDSRSFHINLDILKNMIDNFLTLRIFTKPIWSWKETQ